MRKYILSGLGAMALTLVVATPALAQECNSCWDYVSRTHSRLNNMVMVHSNTGENTQYADAIIRSDDDTDGGYVWSRNELMTGRASALADVMNDVNNGSEDLSDDDTFRVRTSVMNNHAMVGANSGRNLQSATALIRSYEDDTDGGSSRAHNSSTTGNADSVGRIWNFVNAKYMIE